MIQPHKIFGRLGNSMFQYAFLYSYAKKLGIDFYFQDPVFFEEYANEIRALFSIDIPEPIDMVAIHVRRGDYVGNTFHVNLFDTDYYDRAMALFPNETFFIFSDDIEWCKEQEIFKNCEFSEGTELEDLNKMASCKAHIIANSSYSWWSAWLCHNYPNNRVIAPKQWYKDGLNRTKLPSHWKMI
jgi:hypothetical protein